MAQIKRTNRSANPVSISAINTGHKSTTVPHWSRTLSHCTFMTMHSPDVFLFCSYLPLHCFMYQLLMVPVFAERRLRPVSPATDGQLVRRSADTSSFLDDRSKVTGIRDVLSRMDASNAGQ